MTRFHIALGLFMALALAVSLLSACAGGGDAPFDGGLDEQSTLQSDAGAHESEAEHEGEMPDEDNVDAGADDASENEDAGVDDDEDTEEFPASMPANP